MKNKTLAVCAISVLAVFLFSVVFCFAVYTNNFIYPDRGYHILGFKNGEYTSVKIESESIMGKTAAQVTEHFGLARADYYPENNEWYRYDMGIHTCLYIFFNEEGVVTQMTIRWLP